MGDVRELLLIRHGVTDMAGTLCGHSNPPLNAAGRRQASALAPLLRLRDIHRIYTSDLLRALQTAELLTGDLEAELIVRPDLREISFGKWEGKRWSELKATLVGFGVESLESSPDACAAGGESVDQFRARIRNALKDIATGSGKGPVAVVTHLGIIRVALQHLAGGIGADLQQPIHPCSVYRFMVGSDSFKYAGQLTLPPGAS